MPRTTALDRSSFVPLYYQLQELLKEQIESGAWKPGERLPSEPELARRYGVSRVVVRQALAILEDDRQVIRVQGRGTFVADPKLDTRAGGLARVLAVPRDARRGDRGARGGRARAWSRRYAAGCGRATDERVLRLTTGLSVRGVPLAITYSFFRAAEVRLAGRCRQGRAAPSPATWCSPTTASSSRARRSRSRRASAGSSRRIASGSRTGRRCSSCSAPSSGARPTASRAVRGRARGVPRRPAPVPARGEQRDPRGDRGDLGADRRGGRSGCRTRLRSPAR